MANIRELIQSIEAADSSFDEKLDAINKMEETLVAMRQQEEQAVQDNVDLIVEAIKVMENKVTAQLEVAKSIVPEKGDKGDKGDNGLDGRQGTDGKNGLDGRDGKDGIDGKDGVSVTDAKIDFDGSLVISLSTGQEINVGEVVGSDLQDKIRHITTMSTNASSSSGISSVASADGSVTVTTTSGAVDLSVAVAASTTNMVVLVRNNTGATLTKGTAVYMNGAVGQNPTVTKAQGNNDTNSAQTLGLMTADLANNSNGYVTVIGLITNINTSAFTDGQQLYLSPTTAGTLTATKPYAPEHLVYVAVVEHAHPTQGKLFVKVQNGYEMDELHNVSAQSPTTGQTLVYNSSTSLWEKSNAPLISGTTISSTRINPRVTSAASASSLTPDISASDVYAYTALAAGLTINAPVGTPLDGDKLIFRLLDNGTSRALTWNATYTVIGVTLPTATTISKTTYVGCIYNANNTRWDVIAVTTQA
jgi:hypothetical protein